MHFKHYKSVIALLVIHAKACFIFNFYFYLVGAFLSRSQYFIMQYVLIISSNIVIKWWWSPWCLQAVHSVHSAPVSPASVLTSLQHMVDAGAELITGDNFRKLIQLSSQRVAPVLVCFVHILFIGELWA